MLDGLFVFSIAVCVCVPERLDVLILLLSQAFENPAPVQSLQPKSDSELIKEFGITSYVQICLQKQKPTVTSDQQKERLIINKRTLDGLRKVIQESKLQSKIQQMIQVRDSFIQIL